MSLPSLPPPRPPAAAAGTPGRLAHLAARAVRTASPLALAQLLRSPGRRIVLDAIFWQAARQLGATRSAGLRSTVRCHVTPHAGGEPDTYELRFEDGCCRMLRGGAEARPELTLALDDAELVRLVTGRSTPAQGVLAGRIMVRGDLTQVTATLASAFASRPPRQ